jgi:CRP-like cAMP-binding protein
MPQAMNSKRATAPLPGDPPASACRECASHESGLCHALLQCAGDGGTATLQAQDHIVAARRTLCREGEPFDGVPIVCQGWAATAVTMTDGRRQILSFLLPGDVVSALLIFEPVSSCSVEAITELRCRTFARADVRAALLRHPSLMDMVVRIGNDETARGAQLAIDLGRRSAAERIAGLILNLAARLSPRAPLQGGAMEFPLRQHHIADATGLTVVHAGNVLSEFRRAGLIEIGDRALTLADADGLRRVAGML